MTKTRIWLMLLTALVISVVIVAGSMANAAQQPETASEQPVTETTTQTHINYVLRAWEGHLGLFRGDSEIPYQELDMPLTLLSEYDRKIVEQGIIVETEQELRALVEDMTS